MHELIDTVLEKLISYQDNAFSNISKQMKVGEFLAEVKKGKHKKMITLLRRYLDNSEDEKYDAHKRLLPGVTFGATFKNRRRKENLIKYNELVVLDIDKLNYDKMNYAKNILNTEPLVFSFWESPSKSGLKGLVKLRVDFAYTKDNVDEIHRTAFSKLVMYFQTIYGIDLDTSGSDYTRLCFLSTDADLVIKNNLADLTITKEDLRKDRIRKKIGKSYGAIIHYNSTKDLLMNPYKKNKPIHRFKMRSINKFLAKRGISITSSYDDWFRVGMAIANSFTFDIGEEYYLGLCRLDGARHDEIKSKNMLLSCYEKSKGQIKFKTLVFLAAEKGYIYGGVGNEDD